ncbi:antirestriction protein ArdA [Streptomyces sp. NPDC004732]|uniref:antirestriction protein ArdA n=1 Tax=Streptomyces sp. NPDC004732 TaxID=3154290 RepID=UPI0033BDD9D2
MTATIYVASLTDYNAGELHGEWIDANQDPGAIMAEVESMLTLSPTAKAEGCTAEEWAIHDYDGFGELRLSEWETFEDVAKFAELVDSHGAFLVEHFRNEADDVDEIEDMISERLAETVEDCWGDEEDAIAEHILSLMDDGCFSDLPEWAEMYRDRIAEGMARDARCGGEMFGLYEGGGTWHILRSF